MWRPSHPPPLFQWVSDPSAILDLSVDIIAGRGSPEPDWLLCMGWVYLRSTPSVLEFLPKFLRKLADVKDDQRAFNLILKYQLKLAWNKDPFKRETFPEVIVGTVVEPSMQVVLLPNNIARRFNCAKSAMSGTEVVVHCRQVGSVGMTQKESPLTKQKGLDQLGLWALRADWRSVANPGSFGDYLSAITVR